MPHHRDRVDDDPPGSAWARTPPGRPLSDRSGTLGAVPFTATLVRWPGAGSWVFAPVPEDQAPQAAGPFGRVPVTATVDGRTWATSVWRDRRSGWLLPVPARIRGGKDDGDVVTVEVEVDPTRL